MNWPMKLLRNFLVAALIIGLAQWLKGRGLDYVIPFAALWGALAAAVFTGTQYYRQRRCRLCAEEVDARGE